MKKAWDNVKGGIKVSTKKVSRVADYYAKQVKKGYEWLDKFMTKYLSKVKDIVGRLAQLGRNAVQKILEFFGIMPSKVSFSEPGF